jgi:hypothetical protein
MQLGIVGLPQSGKTTLFNLLTGLKIPVGTMQVGVHIESAVVDLDDDRLQALSDLAKPKRTTPIQLQCVDINGLQAGAGQTEIPGSLFDHLAQIDALVLVLRAFEDPSIPHPLGSIDVNRDCAIIMSEFLLNDLVRVESMVSRLEEERGKGARDATLIEHELTLAEQLKAALEAEQPLREVEISEADLQILGGIGLLTLKPILLVVSLEEGQAAPELEGEAPSVALQTKLEMEIGELGAEEKETYRAEYGIQRSGRRRVLQTALACLGKISFFTLNENEVRAWAHREGDSALDAAGTIHSDLARGFIRAEVIAWDELLQLGGLTEARAAGKLRVEGKEYSVEDGEVVYIRFHV